MGKDLNNIEDLFRTSFEGHRLEPSEKVWKNINTKLTFYKYFSAKLLGSIAVIATIAVILVLTPNIFNKDENSLDDNTLSVSEKSIEQSKTEKLFTNLQSTKDPISEAGKITKLKKDPGTEFLRKSKNERIADLAPILVSKSINVLSYNGKDTFNIKATPPPMPIFTVNTKVGCTPFQLELENLTKSAIAFEWSFGDGKSSTEIVPKHVYRYPGVYKVELKAIGLGGIAVTFIDSIVVHDSPVALLNWQYESTIQTGQKIIIPNNSENITDVEWDFGDKCTSSKITGEHVFENEGEYSIVLKVWTKNDCVDSTVIEDVEVISSKGKIILPTAFTPNTLGASSGYYNKADYQNHIFYPKVDTKLKNYKLKVFSRAGIEIFKSDNILFGWNGYYNNRLLPVGVYVYIVSGEFEGGQKFYKKGNVTVLHN